MSRPHDEGTGDANECEGIHGGAVEGRAAGTGDLSLHAA